MSLRRALAILRKEIWHITRDVRLLFVVTLSPAFLLLLLSYVFSFDVEHLTLAVMDQDRSPLSRDYLRRLTADGDLELRAEVSSYDQAEAMLLNGSVNAVLVIPHGFAAAVEGGTPVSVQAIVDGMDSISARQALGQLQARTRAFAAQARLTAVAPAGVEVSAQTWYNATLKSKDSMVPGLLSVVMFMPAMAVTLALAREKETGSFEGLIATPVRGPEYLAGKLAAYILTGLVGTLLALAVAVYWFQVPFRGDLGLFLLLTGLYFLATMGIGLLVANFVASQQTAMTMILFAFFVPSFFLAGLITPLDATSLAGRLSSSGLPPTHFIVISRAVFLKGVGLAELREPAAMLALIGVTLTGLSLALFKKKMN